MSNLVLVDGVAQATVLKLDGPLSLWGGVDPDSGLIVDTRHPQRGESIADKILVMPHGRGSSSSSYVLAEILRLGCGPAGIVLEEPDSILVTGALVARELYGVECPILVSKTAPTSGEIWLLDGGQLMRVRS